MHNNTEGKISFTFHQGSASLSRDFEKRATKKERFSIALLKGVVSVIEISPKICKTRQSLYSTAETSLGNNN